MLHQDSRKGKLARGVPPFSILIVDDDEDYLHTASLVLQSAGFSNIDTEHDSRKVLEKLELGNYGVVVLDLTMPYISGKDLLSGIRSQHPEITVIILSGVNDVATALTCIRSGAFDYITKPLDMERLTTCVRNAVEHRSMELERQALRDILLQDEPRYPKAFDRMVTVSPQMHALFKYAEAIARTGLPILITGETGTGKELMARSLHEVGGIGTPLCCTNIAGIDETAFSDTLFGHVKGAFTGAMSCRQGLVETSAGGTLFLDEIGELNPESQVKLLRLIQEGTYTPLGSDLPKRAQIRIIAATNRNLKTACENGTFRKDLYYRLQAHEISIPPLRDRKQDLEPLVQNFIADACLQMHKSKPYLPPELFPLLASHNWPGNIRELKGLLFDAIGQCTTTTLSLESIKKKIFPPSLEVEISTPGFNHSNLNFPSAMPTLRKLEEYAIAEALQRASGNKTLAANILGITRQTLINRLK